MRMERGIVHINVSNFSASVEEAADVSLRDRPFVIADEGSSRAIVLETSRRAWKEGLRRGMPLKTARRMLRNLTIVAPNPALYQRASRKMMDIAGNYSPVTELRAGGHIFLDITGTERLFGQAQDTAARIKEECRMLGLDAATALSSNKTVSKVATRVIRPLGFASIPPGDERDFMSPQKIAFLPGVGDVLHERMTAFGIYTMNDLTDIEAAQLCRVFGRQSIRLRERALGIDDEPVQIEPFNRRTVSAELVLSQDTGDPDDLSTVLSIICEEAGFSLRSSALRASALRLDVIFSDGLTANGSAVIRRPVNSDPDLHAAALPVLRRIAARRVRIRQLKLHLSRLTDSFFQLSLFDEPQGKLMTAIDRIRTANGHHIIKRASRLLWE
ncbi:hypothetical protein KKF34_14955 [Myxococcota bacterium]|nr:hypothetical protein [Myxococcota bacterium]MBU1382581.1 hypothetical protein [Myxococcota bacterium]MBU1498175.1 hypothetical protein [Myxococcota bacterium]